MSSSITQWNNSWVLSLFNDRRRIITLGYHKCKTILENLEAIEEFVGKIERGELPKEKPGSYEWSSRRKEDI